MHVSFDNELAPASAAFDASTGALLWESEPITFGYRAWLLQSAVVFDGLQLMHTTGPDFDVKARPGHALFESGVAGHRRAAVTDIVAKQRPIRSRRVAPRRSARVAVP